MKLKDYVVTHVVKGDCSCENCKASAVFSHTANLTTIKVSASKSATLSTFYSLVKRDHSHWLDGRNHTCDEISKELGSDDVALMTIGLGHILGAWKASSPDIKMPMMPEPIKRQMAKDGFISLKV